MFISYYAFPSFCARSMFEAPYQEKFRSKLKRFRNKDQKCNADPAVANFPFIKII